MLERLYELRKKRKWSLQETADQLGIAKSTYAGYESGYREPSLQSLSQIADLFETTVDYLLGRTDAEHDVIEITALIKNDSNRLSLDGEPLSQDELIDITAFIRAKRMLKADEIGE
ncbi:helix-turn-helix domain-containing protein [Neobacillus fumarioli]|uniref:helix-turn-helix domain-containing protein n=1 Tax=Neobacillus fumarioli TaxID=105229 RepID=UPI000833342D|nr:helix-turn-helix transcriptional regulator [Neobacillus fumarioli]